MQHKSEVNRVKKVRVKKSSTTILHWYSLGALQRRRKASDFTILLPQLCSIETKHHYLCKDLWRKRNPWFMSHFKEKAWLPLGVSINYVILEVDGGGNKWQLRWFSRNRWGDNGRKLNQNIGKSIGKLVWRHLWMNPKSIVHKTSKLAQNLTM